MSSAYASLHEALRDAIARGLGWDALRPVQELTIAAVRRGSNVVVLAPTAGGKTEAAVIPVLDATLAAPQERGPSVLYICPLRALLNNLESRIKHLYGLVGLSVFKWHGDVEDRKKRAFVADPADMLMTTPESIEAMLVSARTDTRALFANVRFVVIDEVHAFAADDRGAHLASVLERVQACSRHDIQRIALSATIGNPELLLDWLTGSSQRTKELVSPPKPPAPKVLRVVSVPPGDGFAEIAAAEARGKKALMFVESRRQAEAAAGALRDHIPEVFVHHSSVSREERAQAEAAFGEAEVAAIVATATLELGIDVGDLDLVQQLEAPRTVSSFLQRLGRTGRRSDAARMTFYATDAFHLVQAMAVIELAKRGWVEPITPPRRAWHVLVHQLLVSALENPGLLVSELFAKLRVAWPFAEITEDELVALVRHLASQEILEARGGTISLGPEGEKRFSARNYFELFAVFQGAREMSVRTENGDDIGTLQTSYVLTQGDTDFVFVLAGRRWQAVEVNGEAGVIWAKPAPEGKLPRWQSPMGGFVPRTVIEEHRRILASSEVPTYVTDTAKLELARIRETWADVAGEDGWVLRSSPKGVIVFTFAGGRVNLTLAKALSQRLGCATSSEEYTLSVRGTESVTTSHVADELRRFAAEGFADELRAAVAASLPRRPLSKFQPLLPPNREREFLEARVFAFEDAFNALRRRALCTS